MNHSRPQLGICDDHHRALGLHVVAHKSNNLIGVISYALGSLRKVDPVEGWAPASLGPSAGREHLRAMSAAGGWSPLAPEFDAWVIAWPCSSRVNLHDRGR